MASYEVSTKGDKRFSALCAKLPDGRTIEEAYQLDIKGYRRDGGDWRLGKGKPPLRTMTPEQLYQEYLALWREWSQANPALLDELVAIVKGGATLVDSFARTPVSQARALTELVMEAIRKEVVVYVDGSFSEGRVLWAFVVKQGDSILHSEHGETTRFVEMRNVAGELSATMRATKWLKDHTLTGTLCYDYEGIQKWVTGEWKAKTEGTQLYKAFITPYVEKCVIRFRKIDRATNLADTAIHEAYGF